MWQQLAFMGGSALVGAGAWHVLFIRGVGKIVHLSGFDKGCRVTQEAMEAVHQKERESLIRQLGASQSDSLARYARTLVRLHYLCKEGCTVNHTAEVAVMEASRR